MDFGDALRAVKDGKRARRALWAGPPDADVYGGWLYLGTVHTDTGAALSVLLVSYPDKSVKTFAGSNWDLLAGDWEVA